MESYNTYLMSQLAIEVGLIDSSEAYDIQWGKAQELYSEFAKSKEILDESMSEYNAMNKWLNRKLKEQPLKIFSMNRNGGYDEVNGYVITAQTIKAAREIAKFHSADEGEHVWDEIKVTEIGLYSGSSTKAHVIMKNFKSC